MYVALADAKLPTAVQTALLRIFLRGKDGLELDTLEGSKTDLCYEVPSSRAAEVCSLTAVGRGREAEEITASTLFPPGTPPLTLYEICARAGTRKHLNELQLAAQDKLQETLARPGASLLSVLRLVRAGAQPLRPQLQALLCESAMPPPKKRARNALFSNPSGCTGRLGDQGGTALQFVCQAARTLPLKQSAPLVEIAHWLNEVSPLALLVHDATGKTPLEVLMEGTGTVNPCDRAVVGAVAGGFLRAVERYPWAAASLMRSSSGLIKSARSALTLLHDQPAPRKALELLLEVGAPASVTTQGLGSACDVWLGPICEVGSSSAKDTLRAISTLADRASKDRILAKLKERSNVASVQGDAAEAELRLAESEKQRALEAKAYEVRMEELEAALAAAERRAEDAERRMTAAQAASAAHIHVASRAEAPSTFAACVSRRVTAPGELHIQAPVTAESRKADSPEAVIESLRRRRLVGAALGDESGDVAEGVKQITRSLCAAIERLAEDLYGAECHFLYELIQNAEDAHRRGTNRCGKDSNCGEGRLRLVLGEDATGVHPYFFSESDEAGLTAQDVESLCDISASSKQGGQLDIMVGNKGIGFKSVFVVSDCPHILSGGYTFKLDVAGPLGQLGYITPTWLSPNEIETLPSEVLRAWNSGRTVFLLPLRRPELALAIEREMDELCGPAKASVLFLQALRSIELMPHGATSGRRLQRAVPINSQEGALTVIRVPRSHTNEKEELIAEHPFAICRYKVQCQGPKAVDFGAREQPRSAELVLAFPLRDGGSLQDHRSGGEDGPELLFCTLPIRCIGFGFALHCASFHLVASRDDLHRGSPVNAAVRDALPDAFEAACSQNSVVAAEALSLVGSPVADPFWRPAREAILERLQGVACVDTAAGFMRPNQVFLCHGGHWEGLVALLPADLVLRSTGRAFTRNTPDGAAQVRLLRRLGAVDFSAEHLCACLAYEQEPWPHGWLAGVLQAVGMEGAASAFSTVYACFAEVLTAQASNDSAGVSLPGRLDSALKLTSLSMVPLMGPKGVPPTCGRLQDGPVLAGFCNEFPAAWQEALAASGVTRVVPSQMLPLLGHDAQQFLEVVGAAAATPEGIARSVVLWHLSLPGRLSSQQSSCYNASIWYGLAVLRNVWLQVADNERFPLKLPGLHDFSDVGSVLWLPAQSGNLRHATQLLCPSYLGCRGQLGPEASMHIAEFLGLPHKTAAYLLPSEELLDAWPHALDDDALLWEAFLVSCLGVKLLQPMNPAHTLPPDLCLHVGRALENPVAGLGVGRAWRCLLEPVAPAVRDYVTIVLTSRPADAPWLARCPVRSRRTTEGVATANYALGDLFLKQAFETLAGSALAARYFDCPELVHSQGISNNGGSLQASIVRKALMALAVHTKLNAASIVAALLAIASSTPEQPQESFEAHSRLYSALAVCDQEEVNKLGFKVVRDLREVVFHPLQGHLSASRCIWAPDNTNGQPHLQLLLLCADRVDLASVYCHGSSSKNVERYFVDILGVKRHLEGARDYYDALDTLLGAVEMYGRLYQSCNVPSGGMNIEVNQGYIPSPDLLEHAWPTIVAIYRGLAAQPQEERQEPLLARCIVLPLQCPEGGPPEKPGLECVAAHHDGAMLRRLAISEAYWEVSADLANAPAAEWALARFFPADLQEFFLDIGVREVLDREALSRRLHHTSQFVPTASSSRAPVTGETRGRHGPVNPSGLSAEELLGTSGGIGAQPQAFADPWQAAATALMALRCPAATSANNARDEEAAETFNEVNMPARRARSVRMVALPARKLVDSGRIRIMRGAGEVKLLAPETQGSRVEQICRTEAAHSFAELLGHLATQVFEVPIDCLAISVEPEASCTGDCGHLGHGQILLFSWELYSREQNPSFWFGEFCHALAHKAVGDGHLGSTHALVMQALLAWHLPAFARCFRAGVI